MKNPTFSFPLIFLSLVLAVVSAPSAVHGRIIDTEGELVRPGVPYYILPAESGTGGGLVPASTAIYHPKFCPPGVVQSQLPYVPGVPVTFAPWNSKVGFVPLSTNLTIEFDSDIWLCAESKVWKTVFAAWLRGSYVSTGGERGSNGSWFRIEEEGEAYKIVHSQSSEDLSIFTDNSGTRGLVVGVRPFTVKFKKAYATNHVFMKTM